MPQITMKPSFYIGKKNALYARRSCGSLSRFGIRLSPGGVQVFDHLLKRWYTLPEIVPLLSGGHITIQVHKGAASATNSVRKNAKPT